MGKTMSLIASSAVPHLSLALCCMSRITDNWLYQFELTKNIPCQTHIPHLYTTGYHYNMWGLIFRINVECPYHMENSIPLRYWMHIDDFRTRIIRIIQTCSIEIHIRLVTECYLLINA